jgi:ABC-2 type transport system ATP-binding protein
MVEVQGLTKEYRGVTAIENVSFVVGPSEVVGYLGPNGSGKSTTVKILIGLIKPTRGRVLFRGQDIHDDPVEYRKILGYVPEEPLVYNHLTAHEYLQLVGRLRCLPEAVVARKAADLLTLFSLFEFRDIPIASYSKGMVQRVMIAAALLHDPELLVLDEPLSGLDVVSVRLMKDLMTELAANHKTILYISHVLDVVEKVCKRVIVIFKGHILSDSPVQELTQLMQDSSLETAFARLVQQQDTSKIARDIVQVMGS